MALQNLGQDKLAGDLQANFKVIAMNEVIKQFESKVEMVDKHTVRTIKSGKSASFDVMGKTEGLNNYTGGVDTSLLAGQTSQTVINVAHDNYNGITRIVTELDEIQNHFDARKILTDEMGLALAVGYDQDVYKVGVLASRAPATFTGGNAGGKIVSAALATDGDAIFSAILAAETKLFENGVPAGSDVYCALPPAQYALLRESTKIMNNQWGGDGSANSANVGMVGGIKVYRTMNLPSTVVSTGPAAYQGSFVSTVGLIWHKSAIATVNLLSANVDVIEDKKFNQTLLRVQSVVGHGILRPDAAIELSVL